MTKSTQIRIVLVGDSTVTDDAGWGAAIGAFFKDHVAIINHSSGGQSSRSFINEDRLKKALEDQPDYVFIQFGHNDCPGKGPDRETDPDTSYMDFMKIFIEETRKIGAKPVLITSVARRNFDEHGKIVARLTPFADAVKRLAKRHDVPLVDLHSKSVELFERLSKSEGDELQPEGDTSHFNVKGAVAVSKLIVGEIQHADSELAELLKEITSEPRSLN
jgi:lysophospholipase L1-like esterase